MSDPCDMFGKLLGGLGGQSHEAQSELRRRKIIELEADLVRRDLEKDALVRKAQNQNDRAWNRALDAAISALSDDPRATRLLKDLRKKVRHADEFGER